VIFLIFHFMIDWVFYKFLFLFVSETKKSESHRSNEQ